METNENLICQWLQEDSEEEIDLDNEDCSDVELDITDQHVIEGTCESDSEIDGNAKETDHTGSIDQNTNKPEMIMFYNETKYGVDLLDQRCSNYSTSRRTRRWPMTVFYRILDVSASNSYVISLSNQAQKTPKRFKFMKQLAEQLVRPHLERREKTFSYHETLEAPFDEFYKLMSTFQALRMKQ